MRKTIATLGLSAFLQLPSVALSASPAADQAIKGTCAEKRGAEYFASEACMGELKKDKKNVLNHFKPEPAPAKPGKPKEFKLKEVTVTEGDVKSKLKGMMPVKK